MAIAAPVVTAVTASPAGPIAPGTAFTVTVTYAPGTSGTSVSEATVATITDTANNLIGTMSGTLSFGQTVVDPCTAAFSDSTGRAYTPVSNTVTGGVGTAVFSATA